jgi:hypothetical protein
MLPNIPIVVSHVFPTKKLGKELDGNREIKSKKQVCFCKKKLMKLLLRALDSREKKMRNP